MSSTVTIDFKLADIELESSGACLLNLEIKNIPDPRVYRAVGRFFVTGAHYGKCRTEGTSLVERSGGILPHKIFKFGGSEMLFSALVMTFFSEKSTLSKCEKAGVFSAYKCLFPRSR